jgi:formate C-acetyltransferase
LALNKSDTKSGGVASMDTRASFIDAYKAGYLDKKLEQIVGVQTDEPFKRAYMPIGGIRMAQMSARVYGFETDKRVDEIYTKYRKTHNQGVFDVYTKEMKLARHSHIITGLPDTYARGRIIGDYRRVALYGVDQLIKERNEARDILSSEMRSDIICLREESADQIRALEALKRMAESYGFDISLPAKNAKEAIQ